MLVNHPQMHVFHRLEARVLDGVEGQAVLLADAVAVMPIDQNFAPQHQGITAAFAQDAALQGLVLVRCQRVNIGLQFFEDGDVHGQDSKRWELGRAALNQAELRCRLGARILGAVDMASRAGEPLSLPDTMSAMNDSLSNCTLAGSGRPEGFERVQSALAPESAPACAALVGCGCAHLARGRRGTPSGCRPDR